MPSQLHEALIELFRHRPGLAAELLEGPLRIPVPAHQDARVEPAELTDLTPTEYRSAILGLSWSRSCSGRARSRS